MCNIPYQIQYLSTSFLVSGLPYQRPVEEKEVNRLMREWDGRLMEPLVVSRRDKHFYLIDGQHRAVALKMMNGGGDIVVPCKVYRDLTYEMEADLCFRLDKSRKKLSLAQSTMMLIESGTDTEINEIVRLIEDGGFLWTLDKEFPGDYEIRACRAVISAYRLLGREAFDQMLSIMYQAWDGEPSSLKGNFISGMALFMKTYGPELENCMADRIFSTIDPEDVIHQGRQDRAVRGIALRYARALLNRYNAQCRNKLAYRFKE